MHCASECWFWETDDACLLQRRAISPDSITAQDALAYRPPGSTCDFGMYDSFSLQRFVPTLIHSLETRMIDSISLLETCLIDGMYKDLQTKRVAPSLGIYCADYIYVVDPVCITEYVAFCAS